MGLNRNLGNITEVIKENGGKIGIGTSSPNYGLNVVSSDITLSGIVSNRFIGIRKTSNTLPGYLGLLGGDNGDNAKIIGYNGSGTQTFEINASTVPTYFNGGSVLVGTTTDSGYKLDVNGTGRFSGGILQLEGGSYPAIQVQGGSTGGGGIRFLASTGNYAEIFGEYESANNGVLIFRTRKAGTVSEAMRITSGGNVGVFNTLYGVNNVRPGDNGYGGIDFFNSGIGYQYSAKIYTFKTSTEFYGLTNDFGAGTSAQLSIVSNGSGSSNIGIYTNATERIRITGGGETYIQAGTGYQIRIQPNGQINSTLNSGGASMYLNYQGNGAIYAGSSYAVLYAGSDRKIKTDIKDAESTLEKILNLTPRTFRYKERPNDISYGFIAQEVEEVMPEIVKTSEGVSNCAGEEIVDQKSIESYGLAWASILVKAIQEQQEIIKQLTNRIINLENK